MWQANKTAILLLMVGMAALGGLYSYLAQGDELLARKVLSSGICMLLLLLGLFSWLTAGK